MGNEELNYRTLDAYQAAFLVLRGHKPQLIKQTARIVFSFTADPKLHEDLNDYGSGATVEAIRFALAIKNLKGQIFGLKGDVR